MLVTHQCPTSTTGGGVVVLMIERKLRLRRHRAVHVVHVANWRRRIEAQLRQLLHLLLVVLLLVMVPVSLGCR